MVEERERVVLQLLVDVGADVERVAVVLADPQRVALARRGTDEKSISWTLSPDAASLPTGLVSPSRAPRRPS